MFFIVRPGLGHVREPDGGITFGGGLVPGLNVHSGMPVPARECLALSGPDFIPASPTVAFWP